MRRCLLGGTIGRLFIFSPRFAQHCGSHDLTTVEYRRLSDLSLKSLPISGYVFAVVFFLRLVVLFRLTDSPFLLPAQGDMHFYNEWAQRILRGEWTDYRAFYGLPLYPYLLAGLYSVFGVNPFMPGLLQACLEGGTAVILFKLGRHIFRNPHTPDPHAKQPGEAKVSALDRGTAIGLLAAAGWAFFLPAQSYSVILMPTAWLVFIFWLIVWQVLRRDEMPTVSWFLFIGLLVGVTAMGIATILFLIPLIVLATAFRWKSDVTALTHGRRAVMATLLLVAGVGVGTSPAWLHNYLVARDPVFLSAHSGVNLWIGNNPAANGYPRMPLGLRAGQEAMLSDSISGAEAAAGRPLPRSEVSIFWSAKAKAFIAENPGAWLKLLGVKVTNFWNSFQYDDISVITSLREQGVTFPGFRFGLVAAFAAAGIVLALVQFSASRWVFGAVLLHMLSLLSVFVTERYRMAAVPGLLLFAAFALQRLWESIVAARYQRATACAALAVLAAFVLSSRRTDAELWALDPYNSGLHALEAGKLDLAEQKFRVAYSYVPDNAELNFAVGNLDYARGDRERAKAFYGRTLQLNPRHEGSLNNLGVMALEDERWEVAVKCFETALTITADDAKTHFLLARALAGAGDTGRALLTVDAALRLKPDQPEFLELRQQLQRR